MMVSLNLHRVYTSDMLSPIVNSSAANTTSVTLSLSQPTNSLSASQYTATFTSSTCGNTIPMRNGTTTMDSIIFRGLQEGIQYSVRIVATNTDTGLTSAATITTLTTLETGATMSALFPFNGACYDLFLCQLITYWISQCLQLTRISCE